MSQPLWLCPAPSLISPKLPSQDAISPASSACSPRLVSSPCVWQTLKLVWLKRSIAADLYVFSASDAKVPRKQRSTNCPGCRHPCSHPLLLTPPQHPLACTVSLAKEEHCRLGVFLHRLPGHSSKAWHAYPFKSPSGSHQCMSPRRLRPRETWGWESPLVD